MCQPCRRIEPQRALKPARQPRFSKARGSTAARGYGGMHQWQRAQALAAFTPGDPCGRCRRPMLADDPLDLDHTDDRSAYIGLTHRWCNRSHKPEGTARPEEGRQRQCVICGVSYRAKHRTQRACSRSCGVEVKRMNAA